MAEPKSLFLGLDLSTQQLKAILVDPDLQPVHISTVTFDSDLPSYGTRNGVHVEAKDGTVTTPLALYLDALDLLFSRMSENVGDLLADVKGMCGAAMQHGTIYWAEDAEALLASLSSHVSLRDQLCRDSQGAFSWDKCHNWQDSSTGVECADLERWIGGHVEMAKRTGSRAHHRFSGPQILRFKNRHLENYLSTTRISLVSSFLASLMLGKIAPLDISDVCGMNLWNMESQSWDDDLVRNIGGSPSAGADLKSKLGEVSRDPRKSIGKISQYFVRKYGVSPECDVYGFTGDNPATLLAVPLRAGEAIVSLGTSTTFLMVTPREKVLPDPSYHFFNHPTELDECMFMLCYKNGGLARESIRDAINSTTPGATGSNTWAHFDSLTATAPFLGQTPADTDLKIRIGLYFPLPEIIPPLPAGTWRYLYSPQNKTLTTVSIPENSTPSHSTWPIPSADALAIVESQFLSIRLRSRHLVVSSGYHPPQPRRIYLAGGGSVSDTLALVCGNVLGGTDGVWRVVGGAGNACALGAAYKAVWGAEGMGQRLVEFVRERWDEQQIVRKVGTGYKFGVWEGYADGVEGLEAVEKDVAREFV